ncbi:uncharacterized protein LOC124154082 isoform X2 [Ischnura elegans]|uniref:uncharacterized protein LOC124154082 isoform X2 n=1 Tax=Ischnura elegans TaxID=197161 RepID=UPI001ED8AC90|nr:uncharacterized protein LOC124154082 isoform X2 [Ischnura elegans]
MVNHCVVWGCNFKYTSRKKVPGAENVSLHAFPSEITRRELREEWVKAIARVNWVPSKSSAVCSQHFRPEDMDYTGQTRRLRDGAVPSVFPTYPKHLQSTKMVCCSADGCFNSAQNKKPGVSFYRFPQDSERRAAWMKAVRRKNWTPSTNSFLCSEHFLPEDMDRTSLSNVRLRDNAVPSVFPGHAPRLMNSQDIQLQIANNNVPIPGGSRSTSDALPAAAKSSVKFGDKRGTTTPLNFPDKDGDDSMGCLDISDAFFPSACMSNFSERLLMEPSVFEMLLVDENILSLPVTWGRNIPIFGPRVIMYTQLITIEEENHIRPVFYKELCVLESGRVTCSVIGCRLKKELFWVPEGPLESCKQLENILMRLDALELCEGISEMEAVKSDRQMCFLDCLGKWRHKKCLLVPNANGICAVCYPVISSWKSKQLR